jgi:chromosome segregation protein
VDRTELDFGSGVAGIVGPNGCGKSNVVDAIRWVLGEQSPKTLRGRRMEDVVFNGSDVRKATGMAEVTLTLTNLTKRLAAQWASLEEVSVTRRLYRSGESEYLINRKACRLRDIVDLFLDTGLHTASFSIVEQGRVEGLLVAKPDERREIIEEAAGIAKYRVRRTEALRKLTAAEANLERVRDILGEVGRQSRALERQARRASRFKDLKAQVQTLEGRLFHLDHAALQRLLLPQQKTYEEVKAREAAIRAEWSSVDSEIEGRRVSLSEETEALSKLRTQTLDANSEILRLEDRLNLCQEQRDALADAAEEREKESASVGPHRAGVDEALRLARQKAEGAEEKAQQGDKALAQENYSLDAQKSLQAKREEALERLKGEVLAVLDQLTRTDNRLESLRRELPSLEGRRGALLAEAKTEKERLAEQSDRLDGARKKATELQASIEEIKESEAKSALEAKKLGSELRNLEEEIYLLRENLASQKISLTALGTTNENLNQWQGPTPGKGVSSPLQAVLEVKPGFEKAIEAVLGDLLEAFLTKRLEDAAQAIGYLKESGAGRESFLPLHPKEAESPLSKPLDDPRVVASALTVVDHPGEYAPILKVLLGRVLIVESLDAALSLFKEGRISATFVTRDGEVLLPFGTLSGGHAKEAQGPFERKRMMEDLHLQWEEGQAKLQKAQASREEMRGRREALQARTEELSQSRREGEQRLAETLGQVETLSATTRQAEAALTVLGQEEDRLAKDLSQLQAELSQAEGNVEELAAKKEELERSLGELSSGAQEGRADLQRQAEGLLTFKVDLVQMRAEASSLASELRHLEEKAAELEARRGRLEEEQKRDEEKDKELEATRTNAMARIQELFEQRRTGEETIRQKETRAQEEDTVVSRLEERSRHLKDEMNTIQETLSKLSREVAQLEAERQLLRQQARERLEIDLEEEDSSDEEPTDELRATLRGELEELRDKMARIGDVNTGALDEYEELSERHQFLKKQQDDLFASIKKLRQTVDRINRTTRKRFVDAFEAINATFGEVYRRIFAGGRACLVLTEEDNLLEAGVDIQVQPPGKKIGNILLLSAGEKALTAIALLFAVFHHRPSPFCLLDEVDATLDDHNVGRFIGILEELARQTQFIIITHNKQTMTFADVLYGVTMEQKGVSKVVSVEWKALDGNGKNGGNGTQDGATNGEAARVTTTEA